MPLAWAPPFMVTGHTCWTWKNIGCARSISEVFFLVGARDRFEREFGLEAAFRAAEGDAVTAHGHDRLDLERPELGLRAIERRLTAQVQAVLLAVPTTLKPPSSTPRLG